MSETFEPSSRNSERALSNLTALKVPPNSVEAEQAVLGGLMIDNAEWDTVADILLPEDFYRPEHRLIFQVMMERSEANSPIDVVTLVEALNSLNELENAGGLDYLSELAGNARGTANIHAYSAVSYTHLTLPTIYSV